MLLPVTGAVSQPASQPAGRLVSQSSLPVVGKSASQLSSWLVLLSSAQIWQPVRTTQKEVNNFHDGSDSPRTIQKKKEEKVKRRKYLAQRKWGDRKETE